MGRLDIVGRVSSGHREVGDELSRRGDLHSSMDVRKSILGAIASMRDARLGISS